MPTETHEHTVHCWWNPDQAAWICLTEKAAHAAHNGAVRDGSESPLVDVRDMIVVHTALLREFRLAPAAVARVPVGDLKRAAIVNHHLGFLCELLHHHHQGEDELLWPKLSDRVPATALRFIEDVEGQHVQIDAGLQAVTSARAEWAQHPSADHRDNLAAKLGDLYDLLKHHLDCEERYVLPLAASLLTDAEWHAVGEAAIASMPKPALVLSFGMFAYEGDPAVLRDMLAPAPPPVRFLLPRIAPRVYARRAARVHGTRTP